MIRRVNVCSLVKGLIPEASAKASLNRANLLHALDPNPGDLTMTRMKRRWHYVEVRTDWCWKISGWVVVRGEMPIEPRASWFSPKCIEVQPRVYLTGGRALVWCGPRIWVPNHVKLRIPVMLLLGSETMSDKIHGQKGKSPHRQLRSQIYTKWIRRWSCFDNQEVGLEAAIPWKSA